ncbi:MAG: hypothetical protein ACRC9P_00305 [Bacteroides sp.]
MEAFRVEQEKLYYDRLVTWCGKHLNTYTNVFAFLNKQLKYYSNVLKSKPTNIGRDLAESRIRAIKRLRSRHLIHYRRKREALEGFGFIVHGDVVYQSSSHVGYIAQWRCVAKMAQRTKGSQLSLWGSNNI